MKKIIYMAMTINAFIAESNDNTPWSKEEWDSFNQTAKEAGNIVIGRRTYELMREGDGFNKLQDTLVIVVTSKTDGKNDTILNFVHNPKEAIDLLEQKGYQVALIAGGRELNSSMIKEGLIDELYLDVEPQIFSKGISIFSNDISDKELKLLGSKMIGTDTIQLHYAVIN